MPTAWSFESHVAAPPDEVFAWMSDFAEDDHARPAFQRGTGRRPDGKRNRRSVEVLPDGRRKVTDEWGKERFETVATLVPEPREVRIEGQHGYRGVWRAEAAPGGTRVVSEGRLEPAGLARLFAPLFARMLMRQMKADFDGHVADLRESVGG